MSEVMTITKDGVGDLICELTKDLDIWASLVESKSYGWRHHYLYPSMMEEGCLPIRVPGGTVGALYFDDERRITKVVIDTSYVVKTYVSNVEELANEKYVGKILGEW